jgi:prepilin-type N-terminal cleavage/methylation domain-containing protein
MVALRSRIKSPLQAGFTLVELSIVLVIIGLIIGGVLVGQDLISAATVRAQISQIEKYQAAVNTFRSKYGYLPGDMPDPYATQYGFVARGGTGIGLGDGNGIIQAHIGLAPASGEAMAFWNDLSQAVLIEGNFSNDNFNVAFSSNPADVFPAAKLSGNYIYVYGQLVSGCPSYYFAGPNYFGLSRVSNITNPGWITSSPGMTELQAQSIDGKIDDGFPLTGKVLAADIASACSQGFIGASDTTATAGSSTTCYDNSASASGTPGVNGSAQHYSVEMNGGSGLNCALSFQFE